VSQVDVSINGIELQDRVFFATIGRCRELEASVAQVLPCYAVLHRLEQQMKPHDALALSALVIRRCHIG